MLARWFCGLLIAQGVAIALLVASAQASPKRGPVVWPTEWYQDARIAALWAHVAAYYPSHARYVTEVRTSHALNAHCLKYIYAECLGAVWDDLPTVIWVDSALVRYSDETIAGVLVHEMTHVVQYITKDDLNEQYQREAYLAQRHYLLLRDTGRLRLGDGM